ncbi:serine-threonine kinase receptor-associated protein-like [Hydractinia symbiolongicarpus]|uniref:serine-threonine kinase receptor-associated protein-like n=1 Tax=Hydractinia symbiolongicarpus TaxID=13093 RepID=UPI00254BE035|nr:serine-threonine kinase receptor-associated protein-like [Hydractinia symbiolongicarpus]
MKSLFSSNMAAKQIPLTCPGHTRPVVDLGFSEVTQHGYFLISACKDGKPMLRQGDTGDWIGTFEGHKGAVWGATLNKTASLAATAAADFTAKVWDAIKGEERTSFSHKHIVKTVDFSQDDKKLLTGSNEKKMRIFDVENTDKEPVILEGLGGNPKACIWLNDDKNIISGCDEKVIRLWDVQTLKEVNSITLDRPLQGMQLSSDKSVLAIACGKTALFYDTQSLQQIQSCETNTNVFSVSLSPDKTTFVAGGEDFILYKYDYQTGAKLEYYHGHFGPVHCVRYSPDGEVYASGSEDGTLRLWQTNVGNTYGLWKANISDEEEQTKGLDENHITEVAVES